MTCDRADRPMDLLSPMLAALGGGLPSNVLVVGAGSLHGFIMAQGRQILDAQKSDGDRRPVRAGAVALRPCDGLRPDDDVSQREPLAASSRSFCDARPPPWNDTPTGSACATNRLPFRTSASADDSSPPALPQLTRARGQELSAIPSRSRR